MQSSRLLHQRGSVDDSNGGLQPLPFHLIIQLSLYVARGVIEWVLGNVELLSCLSTSALRM